MQEKTWTPEEAQELQETAAALLEGRASSRQLLGTMLSSMMVGYRAGQQAAEQKSA